MKKEKIQKKQKLKLLGELSFLFSILTMMLYYIKKGKDVYTYKICAVFWGYKMGKDYKKYHSGKSIHCFLSFLLDSVSMVLAVVISTKKGKKELLKEQY